MPQLPTPPRLSLALSDAPRAAFDALSLAPKFRGIVRASRRGDGHPVLVLPGYGAADGSTWVIRKFLRETGYQPFALSAGRNVEGLENRIQSVDDATRFRERLTAIAINRLLEVHRMTQQKVSLVGWSMGGLYAFDASIQHPDITRCVITLGTPFGDPRGTSLFNVMRRLSGSKVPIEAQNFDGWLNKACPPAVPTHVIYSENDGIVGEEITRLPASPLLRKTHVDSSHLGFMLNPAALTAIAEALSADTGDG